MSDLGTMQKLFEADNCSKLQAISSTSATAEGRVITLDFSAIRQRFGERWVNRRADVWPKLEAIIEQHAGRGSLWVRILESEYLVYFANQNAAAAQAIAFRAAEDALTHFMGRCEPTDVQVNRVTSIDGDTVSRVTVKPGDPPYVPQIRPESRSFAPEVEALAALHVVADPIEPVILTCGLQQIVNLKTETKVGLRIDSRYLGEQNGRELTIADRAALSANALVTMDRRIAQALPLLFETRSPATLVAPFSLHTFGSSRGRAVVVDQLKRLTGDQRNRLIIELGGFEVGTPSSRLMEAAGLLRPFCRHLGAQPMANRSGVKSVVSARFSAVSVNARDLGGEGASLAAGILAFGEAARPIAPRLILAGLPSDTFLSICKVAGFTLATLEGEGGQVLSTKREIAPEPRNYAQSPQNWAMNA